MQRIRQSDYFYPLIIFSICLWRIFMPQLGVNEGLGWDGFRYYSIAKDGLSSNTLDSYLVLRIFPSLFIHAILKISSTEINPANVILGFKIMNSILIGLGALMVKRIFNQFKLSEISQLIGFVIIFMNYGLLNFTYYYPVMTDTPAYFLSIALFYFFIRGELLNVLLVGLIGAFTLPVLFAMALALLLFPKTKVPYVPINKWLQYTLCGISFVYGIVMGWYMIYERHESADLAFALPISQGMLPLTFLCIGMLFFFIPFVLGNKTFFNLEYYKSLINIKSLAAAACLVIVFFIVRSSLHVSATGYMTVYNLIKIHLIFAFQRPLTTIVNHFNYFGVGILLIIIFWRRLAAFISTFGLGLAGAVFINLFFFSMKSEPRALSHSFPWLLILVSLYIGQFKFNNIFYALIIFINLVASKLWLFFDYDYTSNKILPDGTIDFPDQWFFMNLGMWMTEQVWFYGLIITFVCLLLLFFSLYRINFGKKELLIYKKYDIYHG